MKRFISKFGSYFATFLFCTVLLMFFSPEAHAAVTVKVGETVMLQWNHSSLGYNVISRGPIYNSDSSVVTVVSYNDSNGVGYMTVRGKSPGTATVSYPLTSYYYEYDYRLGYAREDTNYYSNSWTIEVEGCTSHDYYKTTITSPSTCTNGRYKYECKNCDEYYYDTVYAPHNYDAGKLTTPPKPDQNGVTTKTCTLCGDTTTVAFDKSHAAHITTQPKNGYAASGKTAKVTLKAEGDGLKYQWYVKNRGASKFTKSSCTKSSYTAASMNADKSGRQVYCIVKDKYGNKVRSNTVTIYSKPDITKQPANTKVYRDEQAKCSVKVYGTGLTYQWYMKNKGASKFSKSANKTAEYRCLMDDKSDGRQVYCVVTDKKGSKTKTKTVTLSMKPDRPVFITKQPVSTSNYANKKVSVSVKATGKDKKYQWYFKDEGDKKFKKATITTAAYSVTMNADREGRQVYCVIKDAYGNSVKSKTATLGMKRAAKITKQPTNTAAYNGKKITVSVTATGDGIKYQWYVLSASGKANKSSFTTRTYTATMNKERDGRKVYCVITDKYGNKVKSNTVTLSMRNKITITTQPKNVTGVNNQKVQVSVKATGEGLTYQWYSKDSNASKFSKSSFTGNTYAVKMNSSRGGRQIYCLIKDKYGLTAKTEVVTLSYNSTPIVITNQPDFDEYVGFDEKASVSAKAEGTGLTYRWYLKNDNSDTLVSSKRICEFTMSETFANKEVYCKVTDEFGNSLETEAVKLLGPGEIIIKMHPKHTSSLAYNHKFIEVEAEGHDLTYTWHEKVTGWAYGERVNNHWIGEPSSEDYYNLHMTNTAASTGRISYEYKVYCVITDSSGYSVTTDYAFFADYY